MFSALAGLAAAGLGYLGNERANASNSAMAQRQMDFQERMSNTQYQRAMADMRVAGLNPILAYKQGGAGTPSGASATMTNSASAAMDAFSKTTASAVALKQNNAAINLMADQAYNQKMQAMESIARRNKTLAETQSAVHNAVAARMRNEILRAGLDSEKNKGNIKSSLPILQYLDILTNQAGQIFGGASSGVDLYKSLSK